jgi:hypothetical protein
MVPGIAGKEMIIPGIEIRKDVTIFPRMEVRDEVTIPGIEEREDVTKFSWERCEGRCDCTWASN